MKPPPLQLFPKQLAEVLKQAEAGCRPAIVRQINRGRRTLWPENAKPLQKN